MKVIVAAGLIIVIGSISMCGYKLYEVFVEFPEQADVEHLNRRYENLITDLNVAIAKSDSAYSLANQLENIHYPEDTLYVAMLKDDDDETLPIITRINSNAAVKTRATYRGGGYGRYDAQHFWILQHPLNRYGYSKIELFFDREPPRSKQE